jgi:hypothetical protein
MAAPVKDRVIEWDVQKIVRSFRGGPLIFGHPSAAPGVSPNEAAGRAYERSELSTAVEGFTLGPLCAAAPVVACR